MIMKYLFVFLLFLFSMSDEAQTLTGKVVDEKNAPLYDASVVILSRKDTSFVKGHDFLAYINFSVYSNQYSGFVRSNHFSNFNIQLIKSFFNKLLTLNFKINDILKDQRAAMTMYGINALITKDAYTYSREASLTVTYNFNAYHSKYKGTGAGNAESNRL